MCDQKDNATIYKNKSRKVINVRCKPIKIILLNAKNSLSISVSLSFLSQ